VAAKQVMRPPSITLVDSDVHAFNTAHHAERYPEAIDVEDGEWRAWDSGGRRLVFDVVRERRKRPLFGDRIHERVRLRQAEDEPSHEDDLRSVLIESLSASRTVDPELKRRLADLTLTELIAAAGHRYGH
jgi:hypothetical protein